MGAAVIVGRGDIASAIIDDPKFTFFAAGVSNSAETREDEFMREIDLAWEQPQSGHLVYFSSLCVFYADTPYARHKRVMERLIRGRHRNRTIIRLGNITWGTNKHTLINHLRARHAAGLKLDVQPVQRVVHTLEDFRWTLAHIPEWSCELHAPGRLLTVQQIVDEYVYSGVVTKVGA